MSEDFHIFIVFHEKIFDECYEDIPKEILDKHFTFIAVNEDIQKNYTPNKYNVVNEWELPNYIDQFQKKGYKENSAIFHVMANKMHKNYRYVGFFQYDMKFDVSVVDTIMNRINDSIPTCLFIEAHNYKFCAEETWNEPPAMAYLISHYEFFHHKTFSYDEDDVYPLFNSYMIPVETYETIMGWVSCFYSKIASIVEQKHFGHIAGLYERIMAFAIGEKKLRMIKLDVTHDHEYKNSLSHTQTL